MPKEKDEKSLCMSGLRHAEYYGMQEVFDGLYAKSSKNETFTNLMNIILKRENILLAYRNIKSNDGSKTPGTDGVTFDDIGKLMPDEHPLPRQDPQRQLAVRLSDAAVRAAAVAVPL